MLRQTLWLLGAAWLLGLLVLSGCALDPMERLSEDIGSPDVSVRQAAILHLANLRDDRAIEALVQVLENDDKVFDMAGVALVKQGREVITKQKPTPIITMVANQMKNVHLPNGNRCRAAWVLGEIGDREAIPALREGAAAKDAAGNDDAEVQKQAQDALKKLGDSSEGMAFVLPMTLFKKGQPVETLPAVEAVAKVEATDEGATAETPAAPSGAGKPAPKGAALPAPRPKAGAKPAPAAKAAPVKKA